jgi:soluble lytic murein transglycosylase-like protein
MAYLLFGWRWLGVTLCALWCGTGFAAERLPLPSPDVDACLVAAAHKHALAYELLRSIAEHESRFNPKAVNNHNANGSVDYGLVQINSAWLPTLAKYGISQQDLFNPCINADVGAWILASNFKSGVTWDAVGAYNARSPVKRFTYAAAIYNKVQQLLRMQRTPQAMPAYPANATEPSETTPLDTAYDDPRSTAN